MDPELVDRELVDPDPWLMDLKLLNPELMEL